MAVARWYQLVLLAEDPVRMADFWATVLGMRVGTATAPVRLDGPRPGLGAWVRRADGPRTAKNRLHLDVDTAAVTDLTALGATVLAPAEETGFAWTVMADPEGGEFCCFVRDPERLPAYRLHGLVVDCTVGPETTPTPGTGPAAVAAWWGRVLGVEPTEQHETAGDGTWWTLEHATPDERLTLDFVDVPEPRTGPSRVRFDVLGDPADLVALGATPVADPPVTDGPPADRTLLRDPWGNEFACHLDV